MSQPTDLEVAENLEPAGETPAVETTESAPVLRPQFDSATGQPIYYPDAPAYVPPSDAPASLEAAPVRPTNDAPAALEHAPEPRPAPAQAIPYEPVPEPGPALTVYELIRFLGGRVLSGDEARAFAIDIAATELAGK